ncbi:MAG: STAS-like domain-containing protein [Synergistaceae bacterium]|nr:STAS-like domain-containing protein [Synergistaceae bacterium]
MLINVPQFINNKMCTLPSDAEKLQAQLINNIKKKEVSYVDFEGATDIISRFINIALGQLLEKVSENDFDDFIIIDYEGLDPDDAVIIKRALANAKEYYRNIEILKPLEKELFEEMDSNVQ